MCNTTLQTYRQFCKTMAYFDYWKCLISGYGFAGAQPRLAKIAASLAIFRLLAVAPYLTTLIGFC